jgi:hypothetical protein
LVDLASERTNRPFITTLQCQSFANRPDNHSLHFLLIYFTLLGCVVRTRKICLGVPASDLQPLVSGSSQFDQNHGHKFTELQQLCTEFGFSEIATRLSEFRPSMDFKERETEDAVARGRIAALEERANQHSHVIVMLQNKVTQLSTDFG